jgi:helix-turn-helix protein
MDILLTFDDVARALNAKRPLVEKLVAAGELACLETAPGEYRVPPGDLRRFINVRKRDFRPTTHAESAT